MIIVKTCHCFCVGVLVHPNAGVFGAGTGPIFLDNLACSGDEETLLQCDFYSRSVGLHDCLHSQDVGVTCRGIVLMFKQYYVMEPLFCCH